MRNRLSVVGLLTDGRAWRNAAIVVQQLADVQTTLPVVVFNTTPLDPNAVAALNALNADVVSVAPQMPIPGEFEPHLRGGRLPAYHKLALWAQTRYRRIVYLDADVVLMDNIDEMGSWPTDTFSPEACNDPECAMSKGMNAGVMVIKPSTQRFEQLCAYTRMRAARLSAMSDETARRSASISLLTYPEQSLLKEFNVEVLNASLVLVSQPRSQQDFNWSWRPFEQRCTCTGPRSHRQCACASTSALMSRRYNLRPADCAKCPASLAPKVVHYACSAKPYHHSRPWWERLGSRAGASALEQCTSRWTLRWFGAADRACKRAPELCPASAATTRSGRRLARSRTHGGASYAVRVLQRSLPTAARPLISFAHNETFATNTLNPSWLPLPGGEGGGLFFRTMGAPGTASHNAVGFVRASSRDGLAFPRITPDDLLRDAPGGAPNGGADPRAAHRPATGEAFVTYQLGADAVPAYPGRNTFISRTATPANVSSWRRAAAPMFAGLQA